MHKLRSMLNKLFTPITIMFIPHSRSNSLNIKIPSVVLGTMFVFVCVGFVYTLSLTVHLFDYYVMKQKYSHMNSELQSMQTTVHSLKQSEMEFKRLFSLGSKKKVLEAVKQVDSDGSIDVEELKRQIDESMKSVSEIRKYLAKEQDTYRATPQGWPVKGNFSSGFGARLHPKTGMNQFHSGVDISAPSGTAIRATAEGIVSFADWSKGNGKVVVIEHGHGFTTVYAHNSRIDVKAGQTVKRGQVIALTGATGNATGPHVHYEVWKGGYYVNPSSFMGERTIKNLDKTDNS